MIGLERMAGPLSIRSLEEASCGGYIWHTGDGDATTVPSIGGDIDLDIELGGTTVATAGTGGNGTGIGATLVSVGLKLKLGAMVFIIGTSGRGKGAGTGGNILDSIAPPTKLDDVDSLIGLPRKLTN